MLPWTAACHTRVPVGSGALSTTPFVPRAGCAAASSRVPSIRVSDTLSSPGPPVRIDAHRAYAARRVPGGYTAGPFGAHRPRRAILFLRDTSQKAAALAALAELSGPSGGAPYPPDSVEARATAWDAAELFDWLAVIASPAAMRAGLTGWGVSVDHRITLSVATAQGLPTLRAHLETLGVPCGLVVLLVSGPIQRAEIQRAPPNNTLHPAGAPAGPVPSPAP